MVCRWELHGVLALACLVAFPTWSWAQADETGLIGEFLAEEADGEDEFSQEITVEIEHDGKTVTITQTVDGEFIGEIVAGEETTPIRAKSLEDLQEKSAAAHAAFRSKPKVGQPGQDVTASTVTENQGDRRIEVRTSGRKFISRDQQGKDLEITIRQNVEHGTRTERYEAEDLDTLQKKFPKIAQEFRAHAAANGIVNLQAAGAGARIPGNPLAPGPRKFQGEHQGQKVMITDDQGKNIRITITQPDKDKEATEKFEAEDFSDLKQKHPDIAKIYQKFAGKGLQQPPQPFGLINGNVQVQIRNQAAVPRPIDPARQLQMVRQWLQRSQQQLERLSRDGQDLDADTLKKLADEIAEISKKIEAMEAKK